MPRYGKSSVALVWIGGIGLAIFILQRGIGLAVPVEQAVLAGSLLVSWLAGAWVTLDGTADADGDHTVLGSRFVFGALHGLLWVSMVLSTPVLNTVSYDTGTPVEWVGGPFVVVPPAVFILTIVVLVTQTNVTNKLSLSSLRKQYREGKRDRLVVDNE